jgi:hypothetical protein
MRWQVEYELSGKGKKTIAGHVQDDPSSERTEVMEIEVK